ncbi:MAG: Hsp20/alpha crystallin family protein [Thermodesulfobacteriota bacterium]|nr:Hsp20/alpha crystallin family protein [Thermodesulfobacteriota bacterium]
MNLVGWTSLNRLFDNTIFPACWSDAEGRNARWHPPVDIYDQGKAIVIKAELPGVDREDISVHVIDGVLTLKGARSQDGGAKEEQYCRRERGVGRFERSFRLPVEIDSDGIKAEYKDGVLTIDIPKPEEQKPKKITIH